MHEYFAVPNRAGSHGLPGVRIDELHDILRHGLTERLLEALHAFTMPSAAPPMRAHPTWEGQIEHFAVHGSECGLARPDVPQRCKAGKK
jgi:hypothetical protein